MELVIPDGAQVHITIGNPPFPTWPAGQADDRHAHGHTVLIPGAMVAEDQNAQSTPPRRFGRRHPVLAGALALALLGGAFEAGGHFASRPEPLLAAQAAYMPSRATRSEQHAFPDHPLQRETATGSAVAEVPSAFRQQLAQQPRVTPPPGQPASPPPAAGGAANAFGLHE